MKNEIRILLLEDEPADAGLIRHELQQGGLAHRLECVDSRAAFIERLERRPPHLVLSDFSLNGFDGYEALAIAREKCPDVPFIFVTGTFGEEVAIEALKKGATDYVLKHHLSRLVPSVQRALREAAARAERRIAEEKLRESHEQLRALSVHLQHVREEERTRIAREVHDELGQSLTALKLQLTWLAGRLPGALGRVREQVSSMLRRIDETIHTVRRIATELRPGLLDSAGLPAALEWQAGQFERQTGIRCHVTIDIGERDCNQEMNTTFFRIFQETLTHVLRHARANRVEVRLTRQGEHLVLEVKDNGRALTDGGTRGEESIGLLDMRERAGLFGGELEVHGLPAQGTTVRVSIPLPRKRRPSRTRNSNENPHHRRSHRGAGRAPAYSG